MRNERLNLSRMDLGRWIRVCAMLILAAGWLSPAVLPAQTPGGVPSPSPSPGEERSSAQEKSTDPFNNLGVPGYEGECPPPSTQEKIMIGVGTLAVAVVCFLLLVRLMERRNIQKDRSATMGRHQGFSLTLFLSALGLLAIAYLVTGCVHPEFWLWVGFCAALWVIHGIYTLIVVRGD